MRRTLRLYFLYSSIGSRSPFCHFEFYWNRICISLRLHDFAGGRRLIHAPSRNYNITASSNISPVFASHISYHKSRENSSRSLSYMILHSGPSAAAMSNKKNSNDTISTRKVVLVCEPHTHLSERTFFFFILSVSSALPPRRECVSVTSERTGSRARSHSPLSLCVTDIYLNVILIVVDTFTRSFPIKYDCPFQPVKYLSTTIGIEFN